MLISVALFGLIASLVSLESAQVLSGVVEDKYSCPHGWTRYGSKKCLKYVNELQDYERAQATCRSKNHGTLVTVHSHEEQNFVYSYIHSIAASSTPIWLGAKQIDFESILWLDKTENSYTNWASSEPSHPDEICIAINPRNGQWHDVMCTDANVPACERAPTTQWPFFVAFCSEGWFQFNDEKCVRIISSQALNFYESQELCRSKYNSKLLSIKSDKESEFVHNLIKFRDVKLPVWLGAVQNDFSSFNWIDKSDVTFTNWAEGEPNDPDHACISMVASGGKWSDNDCKEQKLILCQKVVPEEGSCETGWLQFRQDKCYRFVHIRLAFDDAESLCNNLYGGHLPSIHSQEEQFMLSQFLASVNVKNGSEIWVGARQMDFHNFNWGDGSLFNYSYWEQGEPSFPAEKCIEMSWRNGRWNDINCRLKRAVLCERQVTSRHHIKPILYQPTTCLDSNCTGNTGVVNSQSIGSSAASTAGDLTVALSNSELSHDSNGTAAVNSTSTTTTSTEASEFILPPDDKPIKVISSIMNREQQLLLPQVQPTVHVIADHQLATANAPVQSNVSRSTMTTTTLPTETNSTLMHYNVAPSDRVMNQADLVSSGSNVSSISARRDGGELNSKEGKQQPVTVAAASQDAINQLTAAQQEEQATVSLFDKIKPQQAAVTSTATTPTAAAVAVPALGQTTKAYDSNNTLAQSLPIQAQQPSNPTVGTQAMNHQTASASDGVKPALATDEEVKASTGANNPIATVQEFAQITSLSTALGQPRERINPTDGQLSNQELSNSQ